MKIFAISDIHIDFRPNRRWLHELSLADYRDDILILAGDVSDRLPLLIEGFEALKRRFREVLFVPGNHDLWVRRERGVNSLERFQQLQQIAQDYGIHTQPWHKGEVSIIPLLGWYDYSFGPPSEELQRIWADYSACKWPDSYDDRTITAYFVTMNEAVLSIRNQTVISFSHFLPRIDVMPGFIPARRKMLYPIFGSALLEQQIRMLNPRIHIYGHSHLNRQVVKGKIRYVNNAYGYPSEGHITAKQLLQVLEV